MLKLSSRKILPSYHLRPKVRSMTRRRKKSFEPLNMFNEASISSYFEGASRPSFWPSGWVPVIQESMSLPTTARSRLTSSNCITILPLRRRCKRSYVMSSSSARRAMVRISELGRYLSTTPKAISCCRCAASNCASCRGPQEGSGSRQSVGRRLPKSRGCTAKSRGRYRTLDMSNRVASTRPCFKRGTDILNRKRASSPVVSSRSRRMEK